MLLDLGKDGKGFTKEGTLEVSLEGLGSTEMPGEDALKQTGAGYAGFKRLGYLKGNREPIVSSHKTFD